VSGIVSGSAPTPKRYTRRQALKILGTSIAAFVSYAVLDSSGYLGPNFPLRRYVTSLEQKELAAEAAKYGDDGDRVAYAVNYLQLPSSAVSKVVDSWNSLSSGTKAFVGDRISTAAAAVVADELTDPSTATLAREYPNLLWIHAHANALFTFPFIARVQDGDARLVRMADLRLSEGPVQAQGQLLDLYYPENDPTNPVYYGKRRYVREGFGFLAQNFGSELNNMDATSAGIISEQSSAASVTIQFTGMMGDIPVKSGDTFIFNTGEVPLYSFTAPDNSAALGPVAREGALSVGLVTMKRFRDRHPELADSCNLSLGEQGYVRLDDTFMQDPQFKQYLYGGYYKGYFAINPIEKTTTWKEYQTVSLVPEQTVRGLGVVKILDFHPAYIQPLSLLRVDPSIVELLVQSPEIYVPSQWHLGHLFEPYNKKESC